MLNAQYTLWRVHTKRRMERVCTLTLDGVAPPRRFRCERGFEPYRRAVYRALGLTRRLTSDRQTPRGVVTSR